MATPTLVQQTAVLDTNTNAASVTTAALGSAATVGNTLIVLVTIGSATAGSTLASATCSDNKSNTYTRQIVAGVAATFGADCAIFTAPVTTGGTGLTFTVAGMAGHSESVVMGTEWTGAGSPALDGTGSAHTSGTTSFAVSVTTAVGSDVLILAGGTGDSGGGTTATSTGQTSMGSVNAVNTVSANFEYKTAGAAGANTINADINANGGTNAGAGVAIGLRASAGAAASPEDPPWINWDDAGALDEFTDQVNGYIQQPLPPDYFSQPPEDPPWINWDDLGSLDEWQTWAEFDPRSINPDVNLPLNVEDPWDHWADEIVDDVWLQVLGGDDARQPDNNPVINVEDVLWLWDEDVGDEYQDDSYRLVDSAAVPQALNDEYDWYEDIGDDWPAYSEYDAGGVEVDNNPALNVEDPPWLWDEDVGDEYQDDSVALIDNNPTLSVEDPLWPWDEDIGDELTSEESLPEDAGAEADQPAEDVLWLWDEDVGDEYQDDSVRLVDNNPTLTIQSDDWPWDEDVGDDAYIQILDADDTQQLDNNPLLTVEDAWPHDDEVPDDEWWQPLDPVGADNNPLLTIQSDDWNWDEDVGDEWQDDSVQLLDLVVTTPGPEDPWDYSGDDSGEDWEWWNGEAVLSPDVPVQAFNDDWIDDDAGEELWLDEYALVDNNPALNVEDPPWLWDEDVGDEYQDDSVALVDNNPDLATQSDDWNWGEDHDDWWQDDSFQSVDFIPTTIGPEDPWDFGVDDVGHDWEWWNGEAVLAADEVGRPVEDPPWPWDEDTGDDPLPDDYALIDNNPDIVAPDAWPHDDAEGEDWQEWIEYDSRPIEPDQNPDLAPQDAWDFAADDVVDDLLPDDYANDASQPPDDPWDFWAEDVADDLPADDVPLSVVVAQIFSDEWNWDEDVGDEPWQEYAALGGDVSPQPVEDGWWWYADDVPELDDEALFTSFGFIGHSVRPAPTWLTVKYKSTLFSVAQRTTRLKVTTARTKMAIIQRYTVLAVLTSKDKLKVS